MNYDNKSINSKIMGPNPLKLIEELLIGHNIPPKATVMDLGSGNGLTSVFLCESYGFKVYATYLWSNLAKIKCFSMKWVFQVMK